MQKNGMATAALILGISSLLLGAFGGIGMILGGLGITFACLSRTEKMNTHALFGLFSSIFGMLVSIVMVVATIVLLYTSPELMDIMEEYYNYSLDPLETEENGTDTDIYEELENYFNNEMF